MSFPTQFPGETSVKRLIPVHGDGANVVVPKDLRSFEILFEFESAVPILFDSIVMGRFENFRIGRVCPLLVVVRRLEPSTALSGTVYRLASSMCDHTPVLFNVFEPLRIGMRNL